MWQAEYNAGIMLLDKYNKPEAMAAFTNALKINPNAAEAHVGKAMVARNSTSSPRPRPTPRPP